MKPKDGELDVDFIGGQGSLSATEEKSLSDFFKRRKLKAQKAIRHKKYKAIKGIGHGAKGMDRTSKGKRQKS